VNITDRSPRRSPHEPFIVTCPACAGRGLVLRDGSQVHLVCRLCWQRGVVARIIADRYARADRPVPHTNRSEHNL
jgi:Ribonuclease G/E